MRGPLVGPESLGVGVQRHPIEEELDERSEFPSLLEQHQDFIKRGLTRYKDDESILPKYKWLREYHRYTVNKWKERNSAE